MTQPISSHHAEMLKFCRLLIDNNNAIVFGGIVRNIILNGWDHQAVESNFSEIAHTLLRNPDVVPPADVDACFPASMSLADIERACVQVGFKIRRRGGKLDIDMNAPYVMTSDDAYMRRISYSVWAENGYKFRMDVVGGYTNTTGPPFNKLDFTCNGFVWSNRCIQYSAFSPLIGEYPYELFAKTRNHKTQIIFPVVDNAQQASIFIYRILKMLRTGWEFENFNNLDKCATTSGGVCDGCKKPWNKHSGYAYIIITSCCEVPAYFAEGCFEQYIQNNLSSKFDLLCPQNYNHALIEFPKK
jgi:hypothetical protein